MRKRDIEEFLRSDKPPRTQAPELANQKTSPNATGSTRCTKASNMYAFGVIAFEVRMDTFASYCSVRSLEAGSRGRTRIFQEERDCGIFVDDEREKAPTVGSPQNSGAAVVYNRTVLGQRTPEAYISYRGA